MKTNIKIQFCKDKTWKETSKYNPVKKKQENTVNMHTNVLALSITHTMLIVNSEFWSTIIHIFTNQSSISTSRKNIKFPTVYFKNVSSNIFDYVMLMYLTLCTYQIYVLDKTCYNY